MHKGEPLDLDPTRAPSVFDIDVLRIARVYAEALLNAAEKQGKAEEVWEHFTDLVGNPLRRSDNPSDPASLMASSAIPRGRKEEVIRKALQGKVDDLFLNFILVLNEHNRLEILRPVAAEYRGLLDQRSRRLRVQVRSAVPLTEEQREQLTVLARDYYHLEPVLVEFVDPALIGGLRMQIGDRVVDLTIRSRLDAIKNQLIARSSHEIQRRRDRVRPD
jgi:F-type H+-transporting ATPase subunit delta